MEGGRSQVMDVGVDARTPDEENKKEGLMKMGKLTDVINNNVTIR
jgi:hypothetical protein